ncbi:Phosphoadenosine phosphosulfate reductase [subsurface metagenome]
MLLARPAFVRKDLKQGILNIQKYWELPLHAKIEYSKDIIRSAIAGSDSPVVCWSGGKDSTVLLHLILQIRPDIPVIHIDTGVLYPETEEFVEYLSNLWELNLNIGVPMEHENFWDCVKTFGWPIFGKSVAQSVGKAVRSGNYRPQMSNLERKLAENRIHISEKCAEYILEKPTKRLEEGLKADLKFIGMLASESNARIRLFVDHGFLYEVKRYYGRGRNIMKCNPLFMWREADIWQYHQRHNIPYCTIYNMGHTRNGCWPCAMGIRNGQLKRLRHSHPHLFRYLILETEFGSEWIRIKSILKDTSIACDGNLERILTEKPEYFDHL